MNTRSSLLRELPPHQRFAVQIALRRFAARYRCPCPDAQEWYADCEAVAVVAVLMADDANPTEPSLSEMLPKEPARALCAEVSLWQLWEQWDDSERQRVLGLARAAENALKRFWRQEHRYYSHTDALVVINEEGEWVEQDVEDARTTQAIEATMEQLCGEQTMERLRSLLDAVEQSILAGLIEGRTQKEIADGLRVTQSAVAHRLQKIRAKIRESLGKAMCSLDDCS